MVKIELPKTGQFSVAVDSARRFCERHSYVNSKPGEDLPLLYYYLELGNATSWHEKHREGRWPIVDRSNPGAPSCSSRPSPRGW
jgi:hypothetical protein